MDISLHTESPIMSIEDDALGRAPFVEMIANAIRSRAKNDHECYTIGIYGQWGEGKTSVLNMLKSHLLSRKDDNILISTFNPWILKDQGSMLMEFFNVLVKESAFKKSVKKIKEYAAFISLGAGVVSNLFVPTSGKTVAKATKNFINAFPIFEQTVEERKRDISKIITRSEKHLVVLIDDVDRLDSAETHALLKLVRQIADFNNVVYVIAMDADIVAKSISQYFGAGTYDDGRRFLEKIVQIPILLPQIEKRKLCEILLHSLSDLFAAASSSIAASVSKDVVEKIGNLFSSLREVYRYINQLSFVLPSLYMEVNIVDLCMLEAIKLFNIQGYNAIWENRTVVLRKYSEMETLLTHGQELEAANDRKMDDLIRSIVNGFAGKERDALENMLKYELLYKELRPESEKLMSDRRLCSDIYFDKYFMQTVPSNIIPDTFLDEQSTDIMNKDIAELAQIFNELCEKYSQEEVKRAALRWITPYELNLETRSERAAQICQALSLTSMSENCGDYPRIEKDDISYYICRLISLYMLSQADDMFHDKEYDKKTILETSLYILNESSLRFAMMFFCQIRMSNIFQDKDHLFSLFFALHSRLFASGDELKIFEYYGIIQQLFFEIWEMKDKEEFLSFIDKSLDNPDFPIVKFISYHINAMGGKDSYSGFIKRFEHLDKIANRLQAVITKEDMKNPSIAMFCEICKIVI